MRRELANVALFAPRAGAPTPRGNRDLHGHACGAKLAAPLPHTLRMAHQSRLRLGRVSLPGQPYHIINTTYGRRPLFADPAAARGVIQAMRRMHDDGWLHSHAWVLMPNHLHWLFSLGERGSLSTAMNRFKSGSAHAVRGLNRELAHVWQTGYFDHGVRSDEDLRSIARYIVTNPLRAGLCANVGDYPWWDAEWL